MRPDWIFIEEFLRKAGLRKVILDQVRNAYAKGYDKISDGITSMPEITGFKHLGLKHPLGVMHDYLYSTQEMSRKRADQMFADGLSDLGHTWRRKTWYVGLRLFGWLFWWKAKREKVAKKD